MTSIISRAVKHAFASDEAISGVTATMHDPEIDPTIRRYLFESLNLNTTDSHSMAHLPSSISGDEMDKG